MSAKTNKHRRLQRRPASATLAAMVVVAAVAGFAFGLALRVVARRLCRRRRSRSPSPPYPRIRP